MFHSFKIKLQLFDQLDNMKDQPKRSFNISIQGEVVYEQIYIIK